jgi:hypothetical protein
MTIDKNAKIELNYNDPDLPTPVRQFKPVLFKEGNSFCMVLGPYPQEGVFGCGNTANQAIKDWEHHFNNEIENPTEGNEMTRFILDSLNKF